MTVVLTCSHQASAFASIKASSVTTSACVTCVPWPQHPPIDPSTGSHAEAICLPTFSFLGLSGGYLKALCLPLTLADSWTLDEIG